MDLRRPISFTDAGESEVGIYCACVDDGPFSGADCCRRWSDIHESVSICVCYYIFNRKTRVASEILLIKATMDDFVAR